MLQLRANDQRRYQRAILGAFAAVLSIGCFSAKTFADESDSSVAALVEQNARFAKPDSIQTTGLLNADDNSFLDDLTRRGIQFFLDEADPQTGLMPDRARAAGGNVNGIASIASVGFGLTAICIGEERGWIPREEAYERCLRVTRFMLEKAPSEHGHFYHFMDMRTGQRAWKCEVSNIDTSILIAGVLTARQHFPKTELATLATQLYENVDWPWMVQEDGTLSMGWHPESGFIKSKWDHFNEGPLLYLLAMGSPTHPLKVDNWNAWNRKSGVKTYAGLTYMQCAPLFTHQYPWCWFDVRGQQDQFANYFQNSQLATIAQRQWCMDDLAKRFPKSYGANLWGITASDTAHGYDGWGGPPEQGKMDGTIVPAAAAGSLGMHPRICLDALKEMKQKFGEKAYLKYGFVDAFNPTTGWYNSDVIGIDVGPTVLMAENCRSGFVWKTFMSNPEAQAALKQAGFKSSGGKDGTSVTKSILFEAPAEGK